MAHTKKREQRSTQPSLFSDRDFVASSDEVTKPRQQESDLSFSLYQALVGSGEKDPWGEIGRR